MRDAFKSILYKSSPKNTEATKTAIPILKVQFLMGAFKIQTKQKSKIFERN